MLKGFFDDSRTDRTYAQRKDVNALQAKRDTSRQPPRSRDESHTGYWQKMVTLQYRTSRPARAEAASRN